MILEAFDTWGHFAVQSARVQQYFQIEKAIFSSL